MLAGRYRILGFVGRGGMGEVYRAHDQILNQTVALKFLSPTHIGDAALVRFRNEVRIARQVSHPNVCRVYDLGMVEGLNFLSMEYIDGEDLASLLRRIGRLPHEKAIEFTRKICAGLSAAHERGVLHRDLKPANIMIDGRGHVRLTDFGLAALAAEIPVSDLRSGTPAYISPEQKAGKEVTARSDIYALGLVLHEMFTGKQRTSTQSNPSDLVRDLDPAIERLILRCLEEEPRRRPNSALSVAMALPGADPVAAALAAGETPSPEMIAASQEKEGFSVRAATLCFVAVVLCFALGLWLSDRIGFQAHSPHPLPPEALTDRAQQLIRTLGYTEDPVDRLSGFDCCNATVLNLLKDANAEGRAEIFASHRPPLTRFWYLQHRKSFDRNLSFTELRSRIDSLPQEEGMIFVETDTTGKLIRFEVRPWSADRQETDVDWKPLFSAAGLDISNFAEAAPSIVPRMPIDTRVAWTGKVDSKNSAPIRVEAASWQGRPVLFALTSDRSGSPSPTIATEVFSLIELGVMLVAIWMAWNNWRLGRGDRRVAMRLAAWTAIAYLGVQVVQGWGVTLVAGFGVTLALSVGAFVWAFYTAIEPYVRRHWPDGLISWARFTAGRFRDPLVASHILVGLVAVEALCRVAFPLMISATSLIPSYWWSGEAASLSSTADGFALVIHSLVRGIFSGLYLLVFVVVLRLVLRKLILADVMVSIYLAFQLMASPYFGGRPWNLAVGLAFFTMISMIWIWLLRRFGLLAMLTVWAFYESSSFLPLRTTGWVAERYIPFHLIPIALAAWALWVVLSTQRRPLMDSGA